MAKAKPRRQRSSPRGSRQISRRQSEIHADQAFAYFKRIRYRLYKSPLYRNKFVAIRDRKVVDVDDDKFALYKRLLQQFPDHRFVASQVLQHFPIEVDI